MHSTLVSSNAAAEAVATFCKFAGQVGDFRHMSLQVDEISV